MAEFLPLDTLTGKVRGTSSRSGTEPKPIDFSDVFVIGLGDSATQSASTPLVNGQAYIDVIFESTQIDAAWVFLACSVFNTVDPAPLNIWPGITTSKTATGFRLQLNGMPDSSNYYLRWAISGINIVPTPATTFILSGPTSGLVGAPLTFTVHLPSDTTATATITPSDSGGGGVFSPTAVTLTTGMPSTTFTYTPGSSGSKTISVTNTGGLLNPDSIVVSVAPVATGYSLSGPASGTVSVASAPFTVTLTPAGLPVLAPVTITPSDGGGGGTFTPTSVNLTTAAPSTTFTYTPGSLGAKTISTTNSGGLINPGNLTYTSSAFDPSSIAGLKLWLKADSMALSDGAAVTAWNDSSATGFNLTGTATFKTNILNGKPIIRFNGTSNSFGNAADIGVSQPDTIFVVAKRIFGTGTGYLFKSANQLIVLLDTQAAISAGTAIIESTIDYSGVFHVFTAVFNSGTGTGYADGTVVLGPAGCGSSPVGAAMFLMWDGLSTYGTGDIAEVLIYNSALSSTNRTGVENYLKTKYGL